ncbi:MAG: hypothetical protein MUC41_11290 [Syntrophobacteraceae bacterium]|jgi:hypothetical protein|nr:hypothetical protein [Syntrophobacteraceae bacterium]
MRGFFFLLSLLFISVGTMLVLYSEQSRATVRGFFYRVDFRLLAVLPAALGLLMVIGAFAVREVFGLALILGILALAKGAYVAFGPPAQIQRVRDWWFEEAGEIVLRVSGLIMFLLGAAMLSWLV